MVLPSDTLSEKRALASQQEARHFIGQLLLPDGTELPTWVELSHLLGEPSSISGKLRASADIPDSFLRLRDGSGEVRLRIETPVPAHLRLHGLVKVQYSKGEASFETTAYDQVSDLQDLPEGAKVHITAALTSVGLLSYQGNRIPKPDGTIERVGSDWPHISWEQRGGTHILALEHDSRDVAAGSAEGFLLVRRPFIRGGFDLPAATTPAALLEDVAASLEVPVLMFSFLSRQTIECFDLMVHVQTPDRSRPWIEARRRTNASSPQASHQEETALLPQLELASGIFAALLRALNDLPARVDLSRALRYHLGSYRMDTVDTRYILAIAALETLVNVLEAEHPTPYEAGVDFGPLDRALRRVLNCFVSRHELSEATAGRLRSRIGELHRLSTVKQAIFHVARLKLSTSGIWTNYKTAEDLFASGLSEAYRARSELVHNTSIADIRRLVSDLARIQVLFERIVMQVLGQRQPETNKGLVAARYAAQRSESGL